ncbi:hypothetical protein NUW54_g1533 [Trametes sanguinea]|uniref:Uncharacterized protein n=1 Tax=Trametes sanguinea TaxID=158606 RepID=A0ACC1Q7X9_9APHY|nr:hypothetical protein NUW54_g1533 [Trametes sanguinea]
MAHVALETEDRAIEDILSKSLCKEIYSKAVLGARQTHSSETELRREREEPEEERYRCSASRPRATRFNKYSQIAARALRASLKEEERVVAEKRGVTMLRYQKWENGQGGPQVSRPIPPPVL